MFPVQSPNSPDRCRKRKLIVRSGSVALAVLFCSLAIASASDPLGEVFLSEGPHAKVLFLSSDAVNALELAKLEAQKRNVQLERITRYAVAFYSDRFLVSLAPPYRGGFDGPEFRVEIRRSDLKILSVKNTLGAE